MSENREYEVEARITRHHLFTVFSRSQEEAESDVENLIEDGEVGEVVSTEVEIMDTFPVESAEDDEEEDVEDLVDRADVD